MAEESSDHLNLDIDLYDSDKAPKFVPETKKKRKTKATVRYSKPASVIKYGLKNRSWQNIREKYTFQNNQILFAVVSLLYAKHKCVQIAWKSMY